MNDFNTHMDMLDNQIKNYMPQQIHLYMMPLSKPKDIFRIPLDKAEKLQFSCIKHVFIHHYNNNQSIINSAKKRQLHQMISKQAKTS